MRRHHLAVLYANYLDAIVSGEKTIECRLGGVGNIPHNLVRSGDLIWLKESAGPVRAVASVCAVRGFSSLTPAGVDWLRRRYNRWIGAPASFWRRHRDSRCATLVWLENVWVFEPFRIRKGDRRAWVVLAAPPIPNEALVEEGVGLA